MPGHAVVLKFLDDDKNVEDGAYFRTKLSVFLSLLGDEGVDLFLAKFLEDFAHKSLLNVVGFVHLPLLDLFGGKEWHFSDNLFLLSLFGRHGGNLEVGLFLQFGLLPADPEAGILGFEQFDEILPDDDPEEEGLALVEVLPEDLVLVAFEIAEGQADALLVDAHEGDEIIFGVPVRALLIEVEVEAELALVDVDFVLEEAGHVRHIFEEGGLHEGDLAVQAGDLRYLVDEVEDGGRDVDHFGAHYLEELPQQLAGFLDEVDDQQFILSVLVDLFQQKLLHVDVVVFAEQLEESECSAQGHLVVKFGLKLEFVYFVPEFFGQDHVFGVEVVV